MNHYNLSRRDFVRRSATGLIGTALLPTLLTSCSGSKGANEKVNIGHIGIGVRGGHELINYFLPLQNAMNLAISDTYKDHREYYEKSINKVYQDRGIKGFNCQAYLDMDELLQRKDIDAVHITTPDHWHLLAAIKAARAGKHVMLARPLGLSYDQTLVLAKTLKEKNLKFHYGTQQRTFEHIELGYKMIKDGLIGEIQKVDVWAPGKNALPSTLCNEVPVPEGFDFDRWTGPAPKRPFCPERVDFKSSWYNNDYSIGFLGSAGAPPLDILVWVMKDKVSGKYTCEGTGKYWPADVYSNILSWDVRFKYENGVEVHFVSDGIAIQGMLEHRLKNENNGTTFYGTKGWISLSAASAQSNIKELNQKLNYFPKNIRGWFDSEKNTMGERFVSIIKGTESELCPLDEAIMSDTMSHMADIAIRTERKVTWDPIAGEVAGDPDANKRYHRDMRAPFVM